MLPVAVTWFFLLIYLSFGEEGLIPFSPQNADAETLVVGTLDGTVYGLNSLSGEIQWSFSTGLKTFSSSHHPIIPGIDGAIHVYTLEGMRHPTNIKKLVDQSPLLLDDDIIYIGEKQTTLFIIDPATGEARSCYKDQQHVGGCEVPPRAVFLGRVDYTVKAVDQTTHEERWNLTLGEYITSSEISDEARSHVPGNNYTALVSNVEGQLTLINSDGQIQWISALASPTVYHHIDSEADVQLFFQEQVLIPDTRVFIGEYEGALFGLPVPPNSSAHSGPAQLVDLHPIVVHSDSAWLNTIKKKLLERASGTGGELIPYVGSECHPASALYPMCLRGAHERYCHKDETPEDTSQNDTVIAFTVGTLLFFGVPVFYKLFSKSGQPKENSENLQKKPKKKKDPTKKKDPKKITLKQQPIVQPKPGNELTVGQITAFLEEVLGYGNSGTVVYSGTFQGRKVAVKRMLIHFYDLAQQEINILIGSDEHPNILRYFAQESDAEFVYLALFFCPESLEDLVTSKKFKFISQNEIMRMLKELVEGIHHLHSMNIVHRDLKPQNILLDSSGRLKISDMGIARKLNADQNSFSTESKGTRGWQAPEVISDAQKRHTKSVDIFSLGCIFSYVLTGVHPFGDSFEQQHRIMTGKPMLQPLRTKDNLAYDLVSKCIQKDPKARPTISEVKHHIFFWKDEKRLQFVLDASDKLEFEKPSHPLVVELEKQSSVVVGPDWTKPLDMELLRDLKKYRKYDTKKIRDLCMFSGEFKFLECNSTNTNKSNHFRDLPVALQKELGHPPHGFLNYFTSRFPLLLAYLFNFIQEQCREEEVFSPYFQKTNQ